MREISSVWMRGGTSKCWVFDRDDLDVEGWSVDSLLLRLFGSPDARQIDGVGGATSTTSKAVILKQSASDLVDVDYTFAQVSTDRAVVDWGSNCGNCSAVVGLYAIRKGWVPVEGISTPVRVRNTNTGQIMVFDVPTHEGTVDSRGTEWTPGVPFPGTPVRIWFVDPGGRTTGSLLPTGNSYDILTDEDGSVPVTLIDAGAPLIIIPAQAVGLRGDENPNDIDSKPGLLARLEGLRRQAAVRMGLAESVDDARPAIPKVAMVSLPTDGTSDVSVRMLSMGRTHPAIAVTGSIAITMAARTPGSIVEAIVLPTTTDALHLQTPVGSITTWTGEHGGSPSVAVLRTARTIAEAKLHLPQDQSGTEFADELSALHIPAIAKG